MCNGVTGYKAALQAKRLDVNKGQGARGRWLHRGGWAPASTNVSFAADCKRGTRTKVVQQWMSPTLRAT